MTIDNTLDQINSRDIIERIEELEDMLEDISPLADWADEQKELATLQAIADEASQYTSDWEYGEQLIRDSYFVEYTEELINDCYEMPKQEGWPFRHMEMDYEAAARELKQDYITISFDGVDYWIRCS